MSARLPLSFRRVARRLLFGWGLLAACCVLASAHPLHVSLTEAGYNRDSQRLELAVRLFPDDFAESLSHHMGRPVSIEELARLAGPALAYLKKHFVVLSASGEPLALSWVGMEVTAAHVWFYCEVQVNRALKGSRFRVSLLQREFPDQLNAVQLRDGAFRQTLIFTRDTAELVAGG